MNWTDTHAHLYHEQFETDRQEMVQRAIDKGVGQMFLPNIDSDSIQGMLELCTQFPQHLYPMLGLHPCDVFDNYKDVLTSMRPLFNTHRFYGVGETGIDLYWDKSTLPLQIAAFEIQVQWAIELKLPLIIHARDSFDEITQVLDRNRHNDLRGIFHCFTGTLQQAEKVMDYGSFLMGLGGVLTFEKSGLAEVVKEIPLEYVVLETDAPFLAPKPFRGKRNESAYVAEVGAKLAQVKNLTDQEIAAITTANAKKMFGW
jgi:TatD DNase family protein